MVAHQIRVYLATFLESFHGDLSQHRILEAVNSKLEGLLNELAGSAFNT